MQQISEKDGMLNRIIIILINYINVMIHYININNLITYES